MNTLCVCVLSRTGARLMGLSRSNELYDLFLPLSILNMFGTLSHIVKLTELYR